MWHTATQTDYILRMFGPIVPVEPPIGEYTLPKWVYVGNSCEAAYDNVYACIVVRNRFNRSNIVMYSVADFQEDFPDLDKHFWHERLPTLGIDKNVHRSWFKTVFPDRS